MCGPVGSDDGDTHKPHPQPHPTTKHTRTRTHVALPLLRPLFPPLSPKPQDLLYTLVVAAMLITAVAAGRLIAAVLYRLLVSPEPHPFLAFPRLETTIAGLILVALTFYSCMALGGPAADWHGSRTAAYCVLTIAVVPYAAFLWWLALARAWMVPQFTLVVSHTRVRCITVLGSFACAEQCVKCILCEEGCLYGRATHTHSHTDMQNTRVCICAAAGAHDHFQLRLAPPLRL